MWEIAQITEHILNKDGNICSVVAQLPNKYLLTKSINYLYPLEIESSSIILPLLLLHLLPKRRTMEMLLNSNLLGELQLRPIQ